MSVYTEFRRKHQEEISAIPRAFAFEEKHLKDALQQLGLTENDRDKVTSLYGAGDIMRKEDIEKYLSLCEKHQEALAAKIAEDVTGNGFILDMFDTELADHEYSYSQDPSDALEALGLTMKDVNANKALRHGFMLACKKQSSWYSEQMQLDGR